MAPAVFLTGLEKSGKTPLRRLLDEQPWIRLDRGRLWDRYYGRFGDLGTVAQLTSCMRAVAGSDPSLAIDDLMRRFAASPPGSQTYARLFGLIAQARARSAGVDHWGEQAAEIEWAADEVLSAFPDALVIHLVRDPRDRYAESRQSQRAGGLGPAVASWCDSVGWATRNQRLHGARYRVLTYEHLVARPDEALATIAEALGERVAPYSREIVPTASNVGRFRRDLSERAIAYIQRHAGDPMAQWGYPLEPTAAGRRGGLALRLVTGPVSDARKLVWSRRQRHEPPTEV